MQSICTRFAIRLTILLFLTAAAWSQCSFPTSPGAVICTPTSNSTVVYLNEISVRSTAAQGATITKLIIYDNNVNIFSQQNSGGVDLYDGSMYNGQHNIVANAWDSDGNLYQAKTNFMVTGLGYGPCTQPSSPSVVICNPPAGGVYQTSTTVDAAARGQSSIKNLSFYLNGKLVTTVNGWRAGVAVQITAQNVNNTLKVVATDTSGNQYSATKTLNAAYTYGQYSCFYTCSPGINVTGPIAESYVSNTFNLNTQIFGNTKPITSMKAYLDNSLVASSSGSTLQSEISDAPDGTHILTIQGWDDTGIEYRYQENININVHE